MNQVEHLIIQALTTADNNALRKQAENGIFALFHENPSVFFINCAKIVSDQAKKQNVRQQTATVMKAVLSKKTENNTYYWDTADHHSKDIVKSLLLSNLISPNVAVMRTGANVIAQIAAIEIVRGQWPDIIDSLAQNTTHDQFNIRRASITTLGFLCEELKNCNSGINNPTCEQILGSLLFGLSNEGLLQISLQALAESIAFLHGILQNQQYFHKTFEYVSVMMNAQPQRVYQIMYQFGKYCYHQLGNYLPSIVQFTVEHIRQRNQVAVFALQLWDTLGGEYSKMAESQAQRVGEHQGGLRNYLQEVQDVLLPEIMQAILILDKSDLDLIDLREVAVKTLTTFVTCCDRPVADKITDGVSRVLGSINPGERQASALIFSSLCYYKDTHYIENCFINGFPHLIRLIADHQPLVRKNTLLGFGTLSQVFPGVFLGYNDIYNFFLQLLGLAVQKDEETRILSLTLLINITDALRDIPNCPISSQPDYILQKLVGIFTNNLSQTSFKQSNQKIIVVLMNLLMATTKKPVLVMLVNHLIVLYTQSVNSNIADRQIVLSQIMTIVHTCVLSLAKFSPEYGIRYQLYKLIEMHLSIAAIEEQGINMISSLAITFKREFLSDQAHFNKYWDIVMQGLQFVEQKSLFKAALNCIADIARCDSSRISNKLDPVFKKLVGYMHRSHDRQIKTQILHCFGDLAIGLKNYSEQYVKTLIDLCNQCFSAVQKFSEIEHEKEYAEQLKESLIDMYHCVVFAQNEKRNVSNLLAEHFPRLCSFIVHSCDVRLKPTVDYLRICLYVIFDSGLFYSHSTAFANMAKEIISSPPVQNLVSKIRNYSANRKEVQDLLSFIDDKSIRK